MSTRCQVKVTGTDINSSESFTLYHHCDGYPSYMLPVIASGHIASWQAGRIGKAAAMVASSDPLGFELEQGNDLHGDIEYYYIIDVNDGAWLITAYSVPFDYDSVLDMDKVGVFSIQQALEYEGDLI